MGIIDAKMLWPKQTLALLYKNILIVLFRHPFSTPLRCFILPVVFSWFLAYARNLFIPPSHYGIATATPVRSLQNALGAGVGRNIVAFVDNGFTGGDIEAVVNNVAAQVHAAGATVQILKTETDLLTTCRSSIRGVSNCFGAAVFYGSPTEGPDGLWNYSLRADGGLGAKIDVTNANNDVEIYPLPLQHAIDFAIAAGNKTIDQGAVPHLVEEYPFTSETQQERNDQIRVRYMGGIIEILAVAFFIGIVGVIYQLVGLLASERELGMTQIIEASMPNAKRWAPQMIRLLAAHLAFDIMFLPGWIAIALIIGFGVFAKTSLAIMLVFNILTGLSLSSFSIFGAAFFHKAQLSGIVTTIVSLLLAVLAQVIAQASTGAVAVLSLLFPPMNYTFFTVLMARWERKNMATDLTKAAPENPSTLPGIVFFVFLIIQILVFPVLGALVENYLYGTMSKGRQLRNGTQESAIAVSLEGFTKRYWPSWWARNVAARFGKKKETVTAVDSLHLDIPRGQIMVLLGANGSGKTTTLETIAGLNTVTEGTVSVDGHGGLGICPQKNVLWDNLTAYEHVWIFNRLKSTAQNSSKDELHVLLKDCDIDRKSDAKSGTLSGGQKRKLQLAMMFTGGSRVCCVDEVSSGVDALARQKLWSILLNERGRRTIIFTTHFLDEADLLSDQIAILSKGSLKAQGSSVQLKQRSAIGYRIHVYKALGDDRLLPTFENIETKDLIDQVVYTLPDSTVTADFVRRLEEHGIRNYEITSPTIEEIFFKVAEGSEMPTMSNDKLLHAPSHSPTRTSGKSSEDAAIEAKDFGQSDAVLNLQNGKRISNRRQVLSLFRKRWTVFQRNYLPYAAALLIPIIAAGLVTLFLKSTTTLPGCSPTEQISPSDINSLLTQVNYDLVVGPSKRISPQTLGLLQASLPGGGNATNPAGEATFLSAIHQVDTLAEFNSYIAQNYANVTPGGFFLGEGSDPPIFAYKGNADISLATITQNALDTILTNVSISSQFQAFDTPWIPGAQKTLQLIVYFGLAMAAYPAFFALYPTLERLRNVRQLHYSNGVRSISLWSAYLGFDSIIVLAVSVISTIIFRGVTDIWYGLGYLFVVLCLYGIASILLSYVISLFAKSQLAAFAFAAGGQAVLFLLYFIAYLSVLTYAPTNKVDSYLLITHFTIALITPAGNLIRALFVALNVFATTCEDKPYLAGYPGSITLYGGPILYLIMQSIVLFGVLLWWDSGSIWARIRRKQYKSPDTEEVEPLESEVSAEIKRVVDAPDDGLRVQHITKAYGSNVAVQDITFGVQRGEVFALLGPNGAGKSTTISLIRGDIAPSHSSGEIYVEDIPVSRHRAAARNHLGVCPQVDAVDQMTVLEHLRFYARIRGIASKDINNNVEEVIRAVGLGIYQHRMAAKLSGGNKRKLSLGIALMGNPSVLLLDEPSSGMDVVAKRVMWTTIGSIIAGRSIVLTTHSMEEADALAGRAGIIGRRMLALGTSQQLRRRHGNRYFVHLIMKTAPHTTDEEMAQITTWIHVNLAGAVVDEKTFHGQLRFSVPAAQGADLSPLPPSSSSPSLSTPSVQNEPPKTHHLTGIGSLFTLLHDHKETLGFEYYSISPTTLDQVFLSIVGKHNIEEENYAVRQKGRPLWKKVARRP